MCKRGCLRSSYLQRCALIQSRTNKDSCKHCWNVFSLSPLRNQLTWAWNRWLTVWENVEQILSKRRFGFFCSFLFFLFVCFWIDITFRSRSRHIGEKPFGEKVQTMWWSLPPSFFIMEEMWKCSHWRETSCTLWRKPYVLLGPSKDIVVVLLEGNPSYIY